jgi:hypothetical protein
MEKKDHQKIIEICRKQEGKNIDLWIKALKYFCDPSNGELQQYI